MGHLIVRLTHHLFNMTFFLLVALAGATVASPVSNRNNNQTLDGNTALMCTAGTSIGERLTTAFTECSPGLMRKEVKRIQFSRSDDQCYSYEEIMAWVEEEDASSLMETADHIAHYECFLQLFEMGCTAFLS